MAQSIISSRGSDYGYPDGSRLYFTNTAAVATYFTTEHLPVAAGKYVRSQFTLRSISTSTAIRARFEFYTSAKVLISSGTQTALLTAVGNPFFMPATVAPAGTAYVKLRFDLYTDTGAGPVAGANFTMNKIQVTYTDTASTVASVRTNMVKNPSLEVNTANWFLIESSFARSTAAAFTGTASMLLTTGFSSGSATVRSDSGTSGMPVTGGKSYTVSYHRKHAALTNSPYTKVTVYWYDSAGKVLDTYGEQATGVSTDTNWSRFSATFTAPSKAAFLRMDLSCYGSNTYFDAIMVEEGSELGTYFDGSIADTATFDYAWTGTAHASTSTQTTLGDVFTFSEPNAWRNILGPTSSINVKRAALDTGSMSAIVMDPLLDPAVVPDIRTGKKVRLRGLVEGVWENIYEGLLTGANTTYDRSKKRNAEIVTRIEITAADAIMALSNQGEARGISSVSNLPFILEGKGVPWNTNGSGGQVTTVGSAWVNENASVLDQVALTRDSGLAYAWVDRNNVLQVWDNNRLSSTAVCTFSDVASSDPTWVSYSDINVDFNSDTCINSVSIKWLRYDPTSGATEEIPYGPFIDAASQATWGPHTAEFTIGGPTESLTNIQAYANAVLTANGTPQIRCNSLTMPVNDARELKWAVRNDLYTPVAVKYNTKVDKTLRITSIEHQITPKGWFVTYGFDVQTSVAQPTYTPAPPYKGTTAETAIFNNINIRSADDATTAAGNEPALKVGPTTGQHLRIDNNEVLAMLNDNTQGTLVLNVGGPINASGFVKAGSRTLNVTAVNTLITSDVTFPNAFPASGPVPTVMLTLRNITNATAQVRMSVSNLTRTGFTIQMVRSAGTGSTDVDWLAVAQ
ncbi:H-type lectin domain-containing protein [Nocardioides sp. Leaf307]|uniref:H-type lectin domain-containing protein n=1 Tax=Nocardioides sp. Leaf307 TaxID=1736331 RepID=UPI00138F7FA8|nr:H-type lectin domain-containing protein [Nocardioides sp. Leaf307]